MSLNHTCRVAKSGPVLCRSKVPCALALVAMLLPTMGCQAAAQLQNLRVAERSSEEDANEFPDGDEGGDWDEGDLEAHLLSRRSPRESLLPGNVSKTSDRMTADGDPACRAVALERERDAATRSAARLPLRC